MVESNFGRRFHDLKYLKVGFFFIFLDFIIHFKASSQIFVETHQLNVISLYCKQALDNYLFNITYLHTTCTIF